MRQWTIVLFFNLNFYKIFRLRIRILLCRNVWITLSDVKTNNNSDLKTFVDKHTQNRTNKQLQMIKITFQIQLQIERLRRKNRKLEEEHQDMTMRLNETTTANMTTNIQEVNIVTNY